MISITVKKNGAKMAIALTKLFPGSEVYGTIYLDSLPRISTTLFNWFKVKRILVS
ncbi:hypothetical protein CRC_00391 [Cylindrospermopsis raciborskii CS-505]|nr:hypothetical protein CRC_00391 [Cylindrospermopsis raciborskii CS-505]